MNKQELIDELTKTQEKFYKVWMNLDLDKSSRDTAINVYTGIMIAKTYIDRLDEPQAEKVEVPDFVAEWYEHHKHKTLEAKFMHIENAADDRVVNWYEKCKGRHNNPRGNSQEILAMMDLFGYETEKEPRWVVKKGKDCVLTSFTFFDEQSVNYDSNSYGKDYLIFTDKSKAEAVATLVDGSVEEV